MLGGSLENPVTRVYLTGEVQVERGDRLLRESALPARQGRLALVYLAFERRRAVPQAELAEILWPEATPPACNAALSAIVSKLRRRLGATGLNRDGIIVSALGCYQLRLPEGSWVDVEAALHAIHIAEAAEQIGHPEQGYGEALIATTILRRPFLAGEESGWIDERRRGLAEARVRGLDCFVAALAARGEHPLALMHAREVVRMEPFRESGYRRLMNIHAQQGDRAEALRVYGNCRDVLQAELGIGPSPETEALKARLLGLD